MPQLDVSDVLLDPDFMYTGIICKRTEVIVGNNGRPQETATSTTFNGVVTTNNGIKMNTPCRWYFDQRCNQHSHAICFNCW